MRRAAATVLAHEERFDGIGYPRGLRADEIPLGARVFSPIGTLGAMTSDRPYRRACSYRHAARDILANAGTQFDPAVIDAFTAESATLQEMVELKCMMTDTVTAATAHREAPV